MNRKGIKNKERNHDSANSYTSQNSRTGDRGQQRGRNSRKRPQKGGGYQTGTQNKKRVTDNSEQQNTTNYKDGTSTIPRPISMFPNQAPGVSTEISSSSSSLTPRTDPNIRQTILDSAQALTRAHNVGLSETIQKDARR